MFDGDGGFAILLCHFERPVLHVASNILIIHFVTDKTLSIEYGVFRVGVESILSTVTNTEKNMSVFFSKHRMFGVIQSFVISEADP